MVKSMSIIGSGGGRADINPPRCCLFVRVKVVGTVFECRRTTAKKKD
jgi:hypothetical protein